VSGAQTRCDPVGTGALPHRGQNTENRNPSAERVGYLRLTQMNDRSANVAYYKQPRISLDIMVAIGYGRPSQGSEYGGAFPCRSAVPPS
jgi:hypothetical protein